MSIYRGQAFVHRLRARTAAGVPAVLTGIPMLMHVRQYPESTEIAATLSTQNGKLVVQDDYIDIVLDEGDTAAIPEVGLYSFDIMRTDNGARIAGGKIRVKQGVTRS